MLIHFGIGYFNRRLRQYDGEMRGHDDQQHEPVHRSLLRANRSSWFMSLTLTREEAVVED
jgi:uncharacterized membrane protein